ncbi:MAG TPA: glycoside hydrolase family 25 protein [Stellaceae bacterium]|jgi:lysozyme|nr:glycoside hydrolase family 25 protein [Stellaceae bacterium]
MQLPATVFDGVIDVSHWNGTVDWPAVAAAGIALVLIKASEGAGNADPLFEKNRVAAIKAGLMVVPYHFVDPGIVGAVQAAHFLKVSGVGQGTPTMIDWETKAPVGTVVAIGQALAAATGRDPVSYYGWAQLKAADPVLARWPLMLPEYPDGNRVGDYATLVKAAPRLPPGRAAARPYDLHQYTEAGIVAGITGHVDRSVWVGTATELRAWHSTGVLPQAA